MGRFFVYGGDGGGPSLGISHMPAAGHSLALKLRVRSFSFTHCRTGSRPVGQK